MLLLTCMVVVACDSPEREATTQTGTPERDARDSIIGQSKLPGAKAVESARDVQATSKERAAALDSIQ
jgi:hypothetical protein